MNKNICKKQQFIYMAFLCVYYILMFSVLVVCFKKLKATELPHLYAGMNYKNWYNKSYYYTKDKNINLQIIQTHGAKENYSLLMADKQNGVLSYGLLFEFQIDDNFVSIDKISTDTLYLIYQPDVIKQAILQHQSITLKVLSNSGDYLIANSIASNQPSKLHDYILNSHIMQDIENLLNYCQNFKCNVVAYDKQDDIDKNIADDKPVIFIYTLDRQGDRTSILLSKYNNFTKNEVLDINVFIVSSK